MQRLPAFLKEHCTDADVARIIEGLLDFSRSPLHNVEALPKHSKVVHVGVLAPNVLRQSEGLTTIR